MKYFVLLLILIGFVGIAFAMHDPNDPNPHPTMPQIQMQNDTNIIKQFHSQYDKIEFIDEKPFFVSEKYDATPVSNKTITFHGVNFLHPSYPEIPNPGGFVSTTITFEDGTKKSVSVGFTPNPIPVLTERKGVFAGMMRDSDGLHFLVSADLTKISPLKQLKSGITIDQIQCKEGFVVVIKKSNGIPNCVKHETLEKLRERGWAEPLGDIVFQRPSQSTADPEFDIIPTIKISKGEIVSAKAIKFNGWTNQPNQEIVLTVTAPNGNVISTGKLSPMNNGTFVDAITTGGPLWEQQDGIYLVTVQQGNDPTNSAYFELELKDGNIITGK